jgi:hypothetical protein
MKQWQFFVALAPVGMARLSLKEGALPRPFSLGKSPGMNEELQRTNLSILPKSYVTFAALHVHFQQH